MTTQYHTLVYCQGLFVHFKSHQGQWYGSICIGNSKQSAYAVASYLLCTKIHSYNGATILNLTLHLNKIHPLTVHVHQKRKRPQRQRNCRLNGLET